LSKSSKLSKRAVPFAVVAAGSLVLAACGSSSSAGSTSSGSSAVNYSTCESLSACGGMSQLVAAAKKEGVLNVTALPPGWANYGEIMSAFKAKYGIKINDINPDGSSAEEINAIKQLKNSSRAPDVIDVGPAFAQSAAAEGLLAPYKVATWNNIAPNEKAANGDWYYDYGGYISIGYNATAIHVPITGFKSLENPALKGDVALDGNPVGAAAAFNAVYAAALANGGSFANIKPGLTYFANLAKMGVYVPVQSSAAAIESGQIKVNIDWDYLNVAYGKLVAPKIDWKVIVPNDAQVAGYYAQAISKYAPDPAAARLWEEFLYSTTGQNLWLKGFARPVELPQMTTAGTVNKTYLSALPPVSGTPSFPTSSELNTAETVVASDWANAVGSAKG
jgi:putative spermidine/putrescine transport system substrate-binding protein